MVEIASTGLHNARRSLIHALVVVPAGSMLQGLLDEIADVVAVELCSSLTETQSVLSDRTIYMVLFELPGGEPARGAVVADHLRRNHPNAFLVGIATLSERDQIRQILPASRSGMNDLLLVGDGRSIRDSLLDIARHLEVRSTELELLRPLNATSRQEFAEILALSCRNRHKGWRPEELAAAVGVHRSTLSRRLKRAGMPPLADLLLWPRIVEAALLLDEGKKSVKHIAAELRFGSEAHFRRVLRRRLGTTPTLLRSRGALACASGAWESALSRGNP